MSYFGMFFWMMAGFCVCGNWPSEGEMGMALSLELEKRNERMEIWFLMICGFCMH
jgi:hypothetical protein